MANNEDSDQEQSTLGPEVMKNFMLNSAEHEFFPAHKC